MVNPNESNGWRAIDSAPKNERVLIEGCNHLDADEMAMAWLDRIDNRWYYAPQGGMVEWTPTYWRPIPAGRVKGGFTWHPKQCPCGSVQDECCQEDGCKWTRDPSQVPEKMRIYRDKPCGAKS